MATSRIVLALNLYLRVCDEGFVTKCGENIGEKLIPRTVRRKLMFKHCQRHNGPEG